MCRAIDQGGRRCPGGHGAAPHPSGSGGEPIRESLTRVYEDLAAFDGAWISLTDVRARLPHIPREELDRELLRLLDGEDVNIAPNPDQRTLTPADRAAAIHVGGKDKHLLLVHEPIGARA